MTFSRNDWLLEVGKAKRNRETARVPQYKGLAQAEVGAKQLTSHPAWNGFVQILSALKEKSEEYLAAVNAEARISEDFSHEGLARVQAARRALHARIFTLEEVIDLPRQIIDDGQKAKEKLEALNHAGLQEKSAGSAAS